MTDARDDLIQGLRELADWYEQHPEVPLPPYPSFEHCVLERGGGDEAGVAEVEQVAASLDATVERGVHTEARRRFAGLPFRVFYVSREAATDWERQRELIAAARESGAL